MSNAREHFALDWIKAELDQTLDSARLALEAYAATPEDDTRMRSCLTSLHQVHGTLLMLELSGLSVLSGEMEEMAQGLLNKSVEDVEKAQQTLMQSILQLPVFLEDVQNGAPDSRKIALPLANELRLLRGESAFGDAVSGSGINLFDAPQMEALEKFERIDGLEKARRIRSAYQQVLLAIIRGEDVTAAVGTLNKVAVGLEKICEGTPLAALWRAFNVFIESLTSSGAELNSDVVKLLRRLDAEMKVLAQKGRSALGQPAPVDLVKQLIDAARERDYESDELAGLDQALEQSEGPVVSGREAMQKAAIVLRDELAAVKDQLDLYVRSSESDIDTLKQIAAPLKQIGSTLSVLGFESSRAVVGDQVADLQSAIESGEVEDALLMRVAGALLQVDENLVAIASHRPGAGIAGEEDNAVISDAQIAVLVEARNGLDQIKQAIVDFAASQWDQKQLQEVPGLMGAVSGALTMIPLPRPAELLERCVNYMTGHWFDGNAPDWQTLDTFADAISGIDYYLERLAEEATHPGDDILELVERSLSSLDESVGLQQPPSQEAEISDNVTEPAIGLEAEQPPVAVEELSTDQEGEETLPEGEQFDLGDMIFDELEDTHTITPSDVEQAAVEAPEISDEPEILQQSEASIDVEEIGVEAVEQSSEIPAETDIPEADDEIIEIFVEELTEVLEGVDEWLPQWKQDLSQEEPLSELRRAFHTLKGSGRIVGAELIGEASWSIENMLNRIIDGTISATPQFIGLIASMRQQLQILGEAFQYSQSVDDSLVNHLMEQADVLASGGAIDEVIPATEPVSAESVAPEPTKLEQGPSEQNPEETVSPEPGILSQDDKADNFLLFSEEATSHLQLLEQYFSDHAEQECAELNEDVMRALHTLKGSASIVGIDEISGLAGPLYEVASAVLEHSGRIEGEVYDFLSQGVFGLRRVLEELQQGQQAEDDSDMFAAEADRLLAGIDTGPTIVDMDALPVLLNAHRFFSEWKQGSFDLTAHAELLKALGEISQEAENQQRVEIQMLAESLDQALQQLEQGSLDEQIYKVLDDAQEMLLNQFDRIAAQQDLLPVSEMVNALAELSVVTQEPEPSSEAQETVAVADENPVIEAEAQISEEETTDTTASQIEANPEPTTPNPIVEAAPNVNVGDLLPEDTDYEILGIFFEESDELLEAIDQSIHDWSEEPGNDVHLENVLRALHTLKGGARLAGLTILGDAAHDFESLLTQFAQDTVPRNAEFFAKLQVLHDDILSDINRIKAHVSGSPEQPIASEETAVEEEQQAVAEIEIPEVAEPAAETPVVEATNQQTSEPELSEKPGGEQNVVALKPDSSEPSQSQPTQEMVRVSAPLLEELVNLAGENSIVRARIEQGMNDFGSALSEMEMTIERVREQLRRLEIETETQVLFRRDGEGPSYSEFDPLEMDRYSQLQQLSRGLSESASDMLDLKDTLSFKARESETLLLQQARLNTELQEGLMRTRMVPFNRLLPRLRRIVRQVGRELNKKVEFHAYNAEGELDRSVLERMVPPLEHMLRNSIDHGIETPELRRSYGKSSTGRIELKLSREAGDVVLEISDDGAGIDAESVRVKAIEKGLMAEDAKLSDEEILEFVLAPGFTTAKTVTQISGRGVGLDVVASEVKKLGGSIQIFSTPGKGTRFLVRLPFTVSVSRALMVTIAEDQYAIPLNNIEGIVRISQQEYRLLSTPDAPSFEYAGVPYRLRYLGNYLGREYVPGTTHDTIPVVLVRSGDHAMAIHVDGVKGSREIVVKSLGPQFAGVGGISGATVLGDGSVVVILDLLALIRSHTMVKPATERGITGDHARPHCVMVVDDSVTVRKVTTRLLERQGMDVLIAKDGVEAMALLQERRPDIMLLDIEMPRMDGFEVARQVRHDDRLSELPIIMITSRTGSKHKEHAAELGVNGFLGKPFQENELLARIEELLRIPEADVVSGGS